MAERKKRTQKKPSSKPNKRAQSAEATKTLLLDVTKDLMLEEGYAAVTTRRVAKDAGVTSALVHYYFQTTDDLLIALFRRSSEQSLSGLTKILSARNPLSSLLAVYSDPTATVLSREFIALANHRKSLKVELARYIETSRGLQAGILSNVLNAANIDAKKWPAAGVSVLLAIIYRSLVTEKGLGITFGHNEVNDILEALFHRLAPSQNEKTSAI